MGQLMMETVQVNALFQCPLCNDLLRSATVINECLHRFCRRCITDYFRADQDNNCPICRMKIANPLQTLKSDLTFQRLLYKVFPKHFHDQIACKSFPRSLTITNGKSASHEIRLQTTLNVCLDYWNMAPDLLPNDESSAVSQFYVQCIADTPLSCIEKLLRSKYFLSPTLQIDLFYQNFVLNTAEERLIDVCRCFDIVDKNSTLDIRFVISPYGYQAILQHLRQAKQSVPSSIDSTLKVKICRSHSSTNDWYISQSNASTNTSKAVKRLLSSRRKTSRRIRLLPTMVEVPPSIFDREHKNICKVPPYIPEISPMISAPSSPIKTLSIDELFDVTRTIYPLDLTLK